MLTTRSSGQNNRTAAVSQDTGTTTRVHDGIAHVAGPVMVRSVSGERTQVGWYLLCSKVSGRPDLVRIDFDSPVADVVTCVACAADRRFVL